MIQMLFIHGFATDPGVWDLQKREFGYDFKADKDYIIVGWSLGGIKAIDLCIKTRDKIKALVLVSAFPKFLKGKDYPQGLSPALLHSLEKKLQKDFNAGVNYFYGLMFPDKNIPDQIKQLDLLDKKQQLFKDLELLKTIDIRDKLPKINVPTLIIHGEKDAIVPVATAKYLAQNIKNSSLNIFPEVGHAPFLEKTAIFNELLRSFVNKNV